MYYAIIGDIINSKQIDNRREVQEKLKYYLDKINYEYQEDLAANFTITLGDEFQGLLKSPHHIFEILSKIEIVISPLKFRFGIGIGDIITSIDNRISIGSDGPAWWHARDMVTSLKNHKSRLKLATNIKISGLKDDLIQELLNVNLSLCYSLKNSWTSEQKKVIDHILLKYGLNDNFIQKEVAQDLNMSPVNINKKLKLSLFYDYLYTLQTITNLLNRER
ncbi:MAG TPA: SatD family protein [Haloplasmataceae bacterium]